MKFRTEYSPLRASFILDPAKPAVMTGSCFSQNIAKKMEEHGWEAVNPSATLYNPVSIFRALEMMTYGTNGKRLFENSLFFFNGLWNSHYFDSSFSSRFKEDCIVEFEDRQRIFFEKLQKGKVIIITLGTSICYHLDSNSEIVGNCHKQPSELFFTKRLSPEKILTDWSHTHDLLLEKFQGLRFIFTVSPVRHLKDGFVENSRSKAVLLLAVDEICKKYDDCCYFPAFEILNDDLRDYRFYASDFAHPSKEAIDYIWEKFRETFIDEKGNALLKEGEKRIKALLHRPKTGALGKPLHND